MKNAVGVPPVSAYSRPGESYRTLLHDNFEIRKSIIQINLAKKPDFALIDGLLAGQGEGPWAANPIEMDVILASKDLVALDAVGTAIMGIDPMRVPYLTYANEKNLGTLDLGSIRIVGATIADVEKKFELPEKAPYIYRKATIVHKIPGPISIDGSMADWNLVRPIRLDKKPDIVFGENEWGGPQDLSLEGRFGYDQDAFYAIVEVRDDQIIHNTAPDQTPPLGDTLELVVSVVDPWFRLQDPAYGNSDFRFRVGYSFTPVLWDLNRGKIVQGAEVSILDTENGYHVELKIPFDELNQFLPAENDQIGLDFSIVDVDDGTSPKEIGWNSGISLREDARLIGVGLLGAESGCADPHTPCIYLPFIHSTP